MSWVCATGRCGCAMKWGEALVYADKKDQAKAQFSRAAQLRLPTRPNWRGPSDELEQAKIWSE
jgi:hypothetical protein